MTWNEFKQLVDRRLAEQGSDGDVEIWYIDVSYPTEDMDVNVELRQSASGEYRELTISE